MSVGADVKWRVWPATEKGRSLFKTLYLGKVLRTEFHGHWL